MTPEIAAQLVQLTNRFYRAQAESFSATRRAPWPGWQRCAQELAVLLEGEEGERPAEPAGSAERPAEPTGPAGSAAPAPALGERPVARLLDIGCGNLRFERFLVEALPQVDWQFYPVDNCAPLLPDQLPAGCVPERFQELDLMDALADADPAAPPDAPPALADALNAPSCQAAVCFGVMHHVPTFARRLALLRTLVAKVQSGGLVCVSFWRFMSEPGLAARIYALQPQALAHTGLRSADLEENDYLLGWNAQPGVYRYCHHFADCELDCLVAALSPVAQPVARFAADGRTGSLNAYLILRVR